ncbi:MAG: antibiotic biosynthesis monooxygenase [Mycobacterium sp.]|jgi:quinol monooxygenase YgiN|nr:antibiotic biosynthesis monooxygenase [Mycobacterium sp.]
MGTVALLVRLQAKPTKAQEVAELIANGLPMVKDEPGTSAWFGIRFGVTTFGLFSSFPDDAARQAHLTGEVAEALRENAFLFEGKPFLETGDVLAEKLPG